jgi:hypothetical protein
MLTLMLYPRFKSLKLIFSFVGHEHEMSIDQKYDRKSLFPMLLKFYYHLHPLFEVESSYVYKIDEYNNLDSFEMVLNINQLAKELVNRKLLIFYIYYVNAKDIKCPLEWWRKHETMFPTIDFVSKQMLGNVSSQIETNKKNSLLDLSPNSRDAVYI